MRQKGNNFVEYALMLGLVVGIGWGVLGSYGDEIPRVFGSAAELLQVGSKSDKVYDRHMKWLQDTLKDTKAGFQSFAGYMGGTNGSYFDKGKGPKFTTANGLDNGLIDSDSKSNFVKQIDSSALESDSWAMVGYKDQDGQLYYAVAIYSPEKNGGKTLANQTAGTPVKTDVYRVNPTTGDIIRFDSRQMKVAENTRKDGSGSKYHVLRDL